jgi:D-tyrosyl-tRNA(Tyr) deacylase
VRIVLQRVESAAVAVGAEEVAAIGAGLVALVGVERGDSAEQVEKAAQKMVELRIFADAEGKMNLAAPEVGAEILVVSQFTLAASLERGRRPSFDGAAPPEIAQPLLERMVEALRERGLRVVTGRFGALMRVRLVNDGPATFVLDVTARDVGASARPG